MRFRFAASLRFTFVKTDLLPVLLFAVLVLGSSCRQGFLPQGPCAEVNCSEHGVCQANSQGEAQCWCDQGYVNSSRTSCVVESGDAGLSGPDDAGLSREDAGQISTDGPHDDATVVDVNALVINDLQISELSQQHFHLSVSCIGDVNQDAQLTLWLCNRSDQPACDPLSAASYPMLRQQDTCAVDVTDLQSPDDPGDQLALRVDASDPDGVQGSPITALVSLAAATVASSLRIEDAPDGSGQPIAAQNLRAGQSLQVYAVSRDQAGRFVALVDVLWSLSAELGQLSQELGSSTIFTAEVLGQEQIMASSVDFPLATGTLQIDPGDPVAIQIERADVPGVALQATTLEIGQVLNLQAAGLDAFANPTGPELVLWSLSQPFATLSSSSSTACSAIELRAQAAGKLTIGADHSILTDVTSAPITITATQIFRSVGAGQEQALATWGSAGSLDIQDQTATFSQSLPARVGVGDVIQYNDQSALAFIRARISGSQFKVQAADGGRVPELVQDLSWSLFRAYTSLYNAEKGSENPGIAESIRDFDSWVDGQDLVANQQNWNIACYADAIETSGVTISGWTTDPLHKLRVYTPTKTGEVGCSQRHDGAWGTGYQRYATLSVHVSHVQIDGLAIQAAGTPLEISEFTAGPLARVEISNNYLRYLGNTSYDALSFHCVTGPIVLAAWNNMLVNDSLNPDAAALYLGESESTVFALNNTAISNNGPAIEGNAGQIYLGNDLAYSRGGALDVTGTFVSADHCAATDNSLQDLTGSGNRGFQTFAFRAPAQGDFRLAAADTGAKDWGANLDSHPQIDFNHDLKGVIRNGVWDIGADEFAAKGDAIVVGQILVDAVGPHSVELSLPYSGDDNQNSTVQIMACNASLDSDCDPLTGQALGLMQRGGRSFSVSLQGLPPLFESGSILRLALVVVDDDGGAQNLIKEVTLGKEIFRSVGPGTVDPLARGEGTNQLTISNGYASFASPLPDHVGVGDAITYDWDRQIAFIYRRNSSQEFELRDREGDLPAEISQDANWAVYRAYTSLYAAERGDENLGIPGSLRNFDNFTAGRDLPSHNESWNIACYADGVDAQSVTLAGWTTSSVNTIAIFTPSKLYQVGRSQQHQGVWGSGYQLAGKLYVEVPNVRVEGLAIQYSSTPLFVGEYHDPGQTFIANNYLRYTGSDSSKAFDSSCIEGPQKIYLWNNIAINDSADSSAHAIYLYEADAKFYVYNNTAVANGGDAFYGSSYSSQYLRNNLGFSQGSGSAFAGTFLSADHSASNDDSADDAGGAGHRIDQVVDFVDAAGGDFHLSAVDTGARGFGIALNSDPLLSFDDDIDRDARGSDIPWSIGADQ